MKKLLVIGAFFPLTLFNNHLALNASNWGQLVAIAELPQKAIVEPIRGQEIDLAYRPDPSEEDVFSLINYFANEYKVDINLAMDLAEFESGFNCQAKSPLSTAKGCYQFLDSTFLSFCDGEVLVSYDNVKCAMKILGDGGISHWLADKNTRNFLIQRGYVKN